MAIRSISTRRLIRLLVGIGLTFTIAGLVPLVMPSRAQEATPAATDEPNTATAEPSSATTIQPTGDNSYCGVCHNQAWRTKTLPSGEILNLYVSPNLLASSVHGENNPQGALGCVDCHGADSFPHNQPTPLNTRSYTLAAVEMCYACHQEQQTELEAGLHQEAIRAGNTQAAVCTDCHGAHNVQRVASEPGLVAGVCGDCHTTTLTEWQSSAHADLGPQGCATCHSPHSQHLRIGSPLTGGTSDELCVNCHKSTDLPNLWVHTQHRDDSAPEMTVACVDCHMYTPEGSDALNNSDALTDTAGDTTPVSDSARSTGHSMLMDTAPCTTCHTQLVSAEPSATEEPSHAAQGESEAASATASGDQTSFIQLLQGLILGLGFGITGAAVFITRGNRRA